MENSNQFNIVIVSKSDLFNKSGIKEFESDQIKFFSAISTKDVIDLLTRKEINVAIISRDLEGRHWLDFIEFLKVEFPQVLRIFLAADCKDANIVDAVNKGDVFKIIDLKTFNDNFLGIIEECKTRFWFKKDLDTKLTRLMDEVKILNKIGISLTSEHDIETLLEQIVYESRKLTNSDAGSLYIVENDQLNFIVSQTESLAKKYHVQDDHYKIFSLPITKSSIAGYVACTGEVLNIEDVYEIPITADYKFHSDFDEKMGYRSKSMLVVPIKDQANNIIGVLQLINRLDAEGNTQVFGKEYETLMLSLASQAGVAIKNAQLVKEIHQLLSSLIEYSASVIDARSSHTAGHSKRVNILTHAIARGINRMKTGPFANQFFTDNQLRELKFASYLHDIGKIGVRERVLDKKNKLEDHNMEAVENRLNYLKKSMELDYVIRKNNQVSNTEELDILTDKQKKEIEDIDTQIQFLKKINTQRILSDEDLVILNQIAQKKFIDNGIEKEYITPEELENLSIRFGNLTQKEKQHINDHVKMTINILNKIPFPNYLSDVPYLAGTHHEKLDGSGYPKGLSANDLSLASRIIAVADYFEALVALDRPYKRPMTIEDAKKIMVKETENNKLDPDIVRLLFEEKLYVCLQEQAQPDIDLGQGIK
jgi:HD-GYP domain-containing protein (c-di-GMP phosphodiesterase class II)